MSRLEKKYKDEVVPNLKKKYGKRSVMLIPMLRKVVISMGLAEAIKDKNAMQSHINEMTLFSGQKPILTKSKKAISNFKLREDQVIGMKVTIRGKRMYDFLDRFCNIVSPRIRDFRGFSKKCDGSGNLSIGLDDQQVFPEINLDDVKRTQGMNITFVTSAQNDDECVEFLSMMGFPFKS